jgi:hypothetical protein
MRRLMAAAVLAVLCATAAACSDSDDSPTASAPGGSSSASASAAATAAAASGAPARSGNTKQVCADAQKVVTDAITQFTQDVSKLGPSPDRSAAAQTVKALFRDWADGLRELADKATDAQLTTALKDTADQIAKVAGSVNADLRQTDKLLDSPEVRAAQSKIESLCG